MRKRFLLLLFLLPGLVVAAQTYSGRSDISRKSPYFVIHFLIRPDSTVALTLEKKDPLNQSYNYSASYHDYRGIMRRASDSTFVLDMKQVFCYRETRWLKYMEDDMYSDTTYDVVYIYFDSVRTFLPPQMLFQYAGMTDTVDQRRDTFCLHPPCDTFYMARLSNTYELKFDSMKFREGGKMEIDPGYYNPVTGKKMTFAFAYGFYPEFGEDISVQLLIQLKNGKFYFNDFIDPFWCENCPYSLNSFLLKEKRR